MLKCPHCGKSLVHGSLNSFYYKGCYGEGGCGKYLLIQNILDEAMIEAYEAKFGERKDQVDFYWLDDSIKRIELFKDKVFIHWLNGKKSVMEMDFADEQYKLTAYAEVYNAFLERVRSGEKKVKNTHLMGLKQSVDNTTADNK